MNEQERKELNGEENSAGADSLAEELEEIRNLFQKELDLSRGETEEPELIQDTDDVDDYNEEEEEDRALCQCCGENFVSRSYGEDYAYCDECRELMKHYPLRKRGVVTILAMIVIFGLSVFFGADSFEKAIDVLDAKIYADADKSISAISQLYTYASDSDPDSRKLVEILVDSFCDAGYLSDALTYINNVFTEQELEKPSNRKYKEIAEECERFVATQQATEGIVYGPLSGDEFDYEEIMAQLDAIADSYIDEENDIKHVDALINYYKYELMKIKGVDLHTQFETLKAAETSDETGIFHWVYLSPLCELAGKLGETDLADKYFDMMMENNVEDMLAYRSYAARFRYMETPDADAMIKLCEDAKKNAYSEDSSYLPILATAYLIKGQGALAYETMQQYMSTNRYSVADCNLYALSALYCGQTETYETMKVTLETAGYKLGETVEKYKNGEMTLAEVIADKGGDIG